MGILKFKKINQYVVFFSVLITVVVTLYSFIPQVLANLNPLDEKQIEIFLKENKSFIADGNVDSLLALCHPDFTMEAIHSTGVKEKFDKSQILKHEEFLTKALSLSVTEQSHITSILDSSNAIVSIINNQTISIKDMVIRKEKIYQTIY
ncbi:MAG: hypothetical protein EOO07_22375, partial [Chitinophagaceae bacterium]